MTNRGKFILIEGLDRAGKSTQCEKLAARLNAKLLKFPNRETEIGKMINAYLTNGNELSDQAVHLLFSANRWEQKKEIETLLLSGTDIVVDRYLYSGIAFSAAKDVPGMDVEWCRQCDVGLPAPDLTIFLDVSETVAQSRGGYGNERYEKLEMQRRVKNIFHQLKDKSWQVVSADADQDAVFENILHAVQNLNKTDKINYIA